MSKFLPDFVSNILKKMKSAGSGGGGGDSSQETTDVEMDNMMDIDDDVEVVEEMETTTAAIIEVVEDTPSSDVYISTTSSAATSTSRGGGGRNASHGPSTSAGAGYDMDSSNDYIDDNGDGTTDEGDDTEEEDFDKENDEYRPDSSNDEQEDDESFMEITRRRLSQEGNCYCGKERNLNIAELLCAACNRWYHESCIGYQLPKLVPFITNYAFTCKNCSTSGLESFKKHQAQFTQMCITALANLTQISSKEGNNKKIFSKEKDIIPFFEMHWEGISTNSRKTSSSWSSTVAKTLQKDVGLKFILKEVPSDPNSPYYGLINTDLTTIKPDYDSMIKNGSLKVTDIHGSGTLMRRGTKRRTTGEGVNFSQGSYAKRGKGDFSATKMLGHGYPTDHPYNKDGYRYILTEPDSSAPFRQEFDESSDWGGRQIPGWLHRVLNPSAVLLALHDRAPQLKVSEDRLSVTGDKGYSMIRATHGVSQGCYYWEAKITEIPEGGAVRLGFSQPNGNLQTPLGFDKYGYSWRSLYGTKFHQAKGQSYTNRVGYGLGDIIGCLIYLPKEKTKNYIPSSHKDKPLVRFKSHLYYEDKDSSETEAEQENNIRKGAQILFFKNGECQGIAFHDIFDGTYYPAISIYKNTTVSINFGPNFDSPPPTANSVDYKAYSERSEESIVEQTVADLLFLTENHGKLSLDNINSYMSV